MDVANIFNHNLQHAAAAPVELKQVESKAHVPASKTCGCFVIPAVFGTRVASLLSKPHGWSAPAPPSLSSVGLWGYGGLWGLSATWAMKQWILGDRKPPCGRIWRAAQPGRTCPSLNLSPSIANQPPNKRHQGIEERAFRPITAVCIKEGQGRGEDHSHSVPWVTRPPMQCCCIQRGIGFVRVVGSAHATLS